MKEETKIAAGWPKSIVKFITQIVARDRAGRLEESPLAGRNPLPTADVVIENQRPGTLAAWGLDYATLAAANANLVMISITPRSCSTAKAPTTPHSTACGHCSSGRPTPNTSSATPSAAAT